MKLNTENCCERAIVLFALNLKGINPWCGKEIQVVRKEKIQSPG